VVNLITKIILRLYRKTTSKHFAFVRENSSKIGQEIGEGHLSELTGRNKTDIRATSYNPFERKFNNPFE
jgi:hypothetical protein